MSRANVKEKRELPMWSVISAIAACLIVVALFFMKGSTAGEASASELAEIRGNQRKFSSAPMPNPTTPDQR